MSPSLFPVWEERISLLPSCWSFLKEELFKDDFFLRTRLTETPHGSTASSQPCEGLLRRCDHAQLPLLLLVSEFSGWLPGPSRSHLQNLCVAAEWGPPTPGVPPQPCSWSCLSCSPPAPTGSCSEQAGVCPCRGPFRKYPYKRHTDVYLPTLSPAFSGRCPAPQFVLLTLSGCHCECPYAFLRAHAISLDQDLGVSVFAVTASDHRGRLACLSYVPQLVLGAVLGVGSVPLRSNVYRA